MSPLDTAIIRPSATLSTEATHAQKSELRQAAEAFEAIFVRRMLAAARTNPLAEKSPFSGPGLDEFSTMRDDHFADLASRNGGLGLADQIERQLSAVLRQQGR